jgi:hypothetical protein
LKQNKLLFQKNSRFLQNFHKVNESQTNPHEEERDGNRREFGEEHEKEIHDNMHKPRKEYEEKGDGRRCKPKKTQNGGQWQHV